MAFNLSENQPTTIKTEDGYIFYRLIDGRYADSLIEEQIDMSWPNYESMISSFHNERIGYSAFFQ